MLRLFTCGVESTKSLENNFYECSCLFTGMRYVQRDVFVGGHGAHPAIYMLSQVNALALCKKLESGLGCCHTLSVCVPGAKDFSH